MAYFKTTLLVLLAICAMLFAVSFGMLVAAGIAPGIALIWNVLTTLDVNFDLLPASVATNNVFVFAASLLDAFIFALLAVALAALFFDVITRINIRRRIYLSKARKLSDHVIIVPFNNFAHALASELQERGQKRVTIAKTEEDLNRLYRSGELALIGDPETVGIFEVANIARAKYVVACSDSDIENALITVTAKSAAGRTRIISRVASMENIPKLGNAGAYRMVMPEVAAGEELGTELVNRIFKSRT